MFGIFVIRILNLFRIYDFPRIPLCNSDEISFLFFFKKKAGRLFSRSLFYLSPN